MKVSKATVVIAVCASLSSCKYAFRSHVLGAIQQTMLIKGYSCDASEDEICDSVIETMQRLTAMEQAVPVLKEVSTCEGINSRRQCY